MVHISRSRLPLQTGNAHSRKPKAFFAVRAINKSAQNLSALFDLSRKRRKTSGFTFASGTNRKEYGSLRVPWVRSPPRNNGCR